jgi:hypothetical protein
MKASYVESKKKLCRKRTYWMNIKITRIQEKSKERKVKILKYVIPKILNLKWWWSLDKAM